MADLTRIGSLDGLRATAAVLIVAHHLGLASFAASLTARGQGAAGTFLSHFGASGVALFFTLSAVVLLRPYLQAGRPMEVGKYAWRRATRLWPPFFGAWLFAGFVVLLLSSMPTWWPSAMPAFSASTWLSQAFVVYIGRAPYNFAWWTLTIEVVFYALAPLVVFILYRRSITMTWLLFALTVGVSLVAGVFEPPGGTTIGAMRLLSFASCFAGGLVLAKQALGAATRAGLAGLGLIVIAVSSFSVQLNSHVGYGLLYMAIVAQAMERESRIATWLSRPLMIWLGERSYSLFLTHYSVIALSCWSTSWMISGKTAAFFVITRLLAVIGSLAAACLLFELVESRFAHGLVSVGQWWPGKCSMASEPTART